MWHQLRWDTTLDGLSKFKGVKLFVYTYLSVVEEKFILSWRAYTYLRNKYSSRWVKLKLKLILESAKYNNMSYLGTQ